MRYRIRTTRLLACTALGLSSASLAAAAELAPVTPPDNKSVIVGGMSADGSVVVGTLNPALAFERSGFVWTQPDGMRLVGDAALGGTFTQRFTATGVSNDGGTIVGQASPDMLGGGALARGYLWTAAGGFVDLGHLDGLPTSDALGISGDGQTVVGSSVNAAGDYRGFRWQTGDMEDIGAFSAQYPQMAASYDGSVIVGNTLTQMQVSNPFNDTVITTNVPVASVWTEATGQLAQLPLLNGGTQSVARDVSDDGRVIVGQAHNGATGKMHAVRWVDTDPQDLTTAGSGLGDNYSFALGVSGNGAVVVGEATVDGPGGPQRGFRWAQDSGMQTVEDWLRASGAVIVTDITYAARATNCDGSVVVGETGLSTTGNQMFIARGNGDGSTNCDGSAGGGDIGGGDTGGGDTGGGDTGGGDTGSGDTGGGDTGGGDTGGDTGGGDTGDGDTGGGGTGGIGLIIVDEFNASLAATGAANVALLGNANLLVNGAGSRPLDRRADPGKTIAWIGGDWGRIDVAGNDGGIGVGEIGVGHNFGVVQVNAVAGYTRFDQSTTLGGNAGLSAGYVKVEALSRLYATADGGLWGAVTASGMWGNADFTRNYINGGVIDSSVGSTDAWGYGLRGRLQWENAIRHFSPYADLSYSRGCFDAYNETGGGFPAAFNKLCDASTELRYGFDVTYPVTDAFRLIGTLEGVHRFEDESAKVTGRAIGLYAFDLGSVTYQQDWLRAGAGFEADIGVSTLSVMGNATTQSNGPNAWIAANWRVTF